MCPTGSTGAGSLTPDFNVSLTDYQRNRALLLGAEGQEWIDNLPAVIADLCSWWNLTPHTQLDGGTEAVVVSVRRTDGIPAILKIASSPLTDEARALQLANGIGYAQLYEYDEQANALLLEALGDKLVDHTYTIDEYLHIVCQTLETSWQRLPDGNGLPTGAERAQWHHNFISEKWAEFSPDCPHDVRDNALRIADTRVSAYDPADSVLVHGDAQIWNTLLTGELEDGLPVCKFVDPDGAFAERACDLGVSQREWIDDLLKGDPLANGRARCTKLAKLTGEPQTPIWEWGCLEVISTSLVYLQLDDAVEAQKYLNLASAWLS